MDGAQEPGPRLRSWIGSFSVCLRPSLHSSWLLFSCSPQPWTDHSLCAFVHRLTQDTWILWGLRSKFVPEFLNSHLIFMTTLWYRQGTIFFILTPPTNLFSSSLGKTHDHVSPGDWGAVETTPSSQHTFAWFMFAYHDLFSEFYFSDKYAFLYLNQH